MMDFKQFDEWYKEQEIGFSEKFETAIDASIKQFVKDAYIAGLTQGFKGRKSDKEISQAHAKWFCRTIEPLLTTFMEHGIKHGKKD